MCIISLLQYFIVLTDMENDQKRVLCDIHSLPEIVLDFPHSYTFPHTIHLAKIFLKLYSYPKFTDQFASKRRVFSSLYIHASLHTTPQEKNKLS